MKERIERIKEKLKQAAKRKIQCFGSGLPPRTGFGSSGHRWQSFPVCEDKVVEFETKYNITLPEEFRTFIREIGVGAGPYYGVHNLMNWLCDEPEGSEAELSFLSKPCLIKPTMCGGQGHTGWEEKLENDGIPLEQIYQGILSIVSQGCTYLNGLIVTGEHRGTVLALDLDWQVPQWRNPSFLDWYEKWLDRVLEGKRT